ncbi:tetratricopeptide repeat protein [Bacillus pacificus]
MKKKRNFKKRDMKIAASTQVLEKDNDELSIEDIHWEYSVNEKFEPDTYDKLMPLLYPKEIHEEGISEEEIKHRFAVEKLFYEKDNLSLLLKYIYGKCGKLSKASVEATHFLMVISRIMYLYHTLGDFKGALELLKVAGVGNCSKALLKIDEEAREQELVNYYYFVFLYLITKKENEEFLEEDKEITVNLFELCIDNRIELQNISYYRVDTYYIARLFFMNYQHLYSKVGKQKFEHVVMNFSHLLLNKKFYFFDSINGWKSSTQNFLEEWDEFYSGVEELILNDLVIRFLYFIKPVFKGYIYFEFRDPIEGVLPKFKTFFKKWKVDFVMKYRDVLGTLTKKICEIDDYGQNFICSQQDITCFFDLLDESKHTKYKKKFAEEYILSNITSYSFMKFYEEKMYRQFALLYNKCENEKLKEQVKNGLSFELAYCLSESGEKEQAKEIYEAMIKKGKEGSGVFNNLGVIYRDIDKNYMKALDLFNKANKILPNDQIIIQNINTTKKMIDEQKSHPQKIVERYFKKTDSQHKKIIFTIYRFQGQEYVSNELLMNATNFKGRYFEKLIRHLQSLELIYFDAGRGWYIDQAIKENVESYINPKLERQIIKWDNNCFYRPIFYHEAEINLYRVLKELFPMHLVFPNMDLKTIIDAEKNP